MTSVETLYESAEKISAAKDNFEQFVDEYNVIVSSVKNVGSSSSSKRLASQFIVRFFPRFPSLTESALDAILDLCEDESVDVRKQAIKDLPSLCRESKNYLPKIVDVLTQLLVTDDSAEQQVVQHSLMTLFRKDAKGTLLGLFSQIRNGSALTRNRAIRFLHLKLKVDDKLLSKEAEVCLLQQIKESLNRRDDKENKKTNVAEEFHLFMDMLVSTSIPKMMSGQLQLLEIASKMAGIDDEDDEKKAEGDKFDASNQEEVDKFLLCANAAVKLFSSHAKSTRFCEYACLHILPQLHSINDLEVQSQVLKTVAEIALHTGNLNQPLVAVTNIHQKLLDYMPLPPEEISVGDEQQQEFEFTKVECLLLAFHMVGRQAEGFLNDDNDRLKDFRCRLQYFARGVQGFIRKLKEFLASKSKAELEQDENKVKSVALRCMLNIQVLIKDLFHSPPIYKAKIQVSWKPTDDESKKPSVTKRHAIAFDKDSNNESASSGSSGNKRSYYGNRRESNGNRAYGSYSVPSGKYSGNFNNQGSGGYYGGSGGYYRGSNRGRGGSWNRRY